MDGKNAGYIGAYGNIVYPKTSFRCYTIVSAKCGAPAFRVRPKWTIDEHYKLFEVFYAEWDYHMLTNPAPGGEGYLMPTD